MLVEPIDLPVYLTGERSFSKPSRRRGRPPILRAPRPTQRVKTPLSRDLRKRREERDTIFTPYTKAYGLPNRFGRVSPVVGSELRLCVFLCSFHPSGSFFLLSWHLFSFVPVTFRPNCLIRILSQRWSGRLASEAPKQPQWQRHPISQPAEHSFPDPAR